MPNNEIETPLYRDIDFLREETLCASSQKEVEYVSPFYKDTMDLIHAPSFRRLQGKMHLFPVVESDFFRNRLTHSLEVANICKLIGLKLNAEELEIKDTPLDLDLLEFAGLAHDLGHPPFGHNGELVLDKIMRSKGGFESNAQALRILSVLEKKSQNNETPYDSRNIGVDKSGNDYRIGLNLTLRSLAAILKYDNEIKLVRQDVDYIVKGYYKSEGNIVKKIKQTLGSKPFSGTFKTIECQIMDIADDIANAIYDLEDTFKSGFISPLDLLALPPRVYKSIANSVGNTVKEAISPNDILNEIQSIFECFLKNTTDPVHKDYDSCNLLYVSSAYQQSKENALNGYFRTEFSGKLLEEFVSGVQLEYNKASPIFSKVYLSPTMFRRVEILKRITYNTIISSPSVRVCEFRGTEIVKTIFEALISNNGTQLLPYDTQEFLEREPTESGRYRIICDYVSGMTDTFAIDFYSRLKSNNSHTLFMPL